MEIKIDFGHFGFSVKATISKDGDKWRVLLGDDLQVGISGFGRSALEAIEDFKSEFINS